MDDSGNQAIKCGNLAITVQKKAPNSCQRRDPDDNQQLPSSCTDAPGWSLEAIPGQRDWRMLVPYPLPCFKKRWTTKEVNPIKAFLLGCQDYSKTFYFSLTWGPHSAHAFQQRSHATKVHKAIGGKHPNMILRSPHPLKAISNRKMSHRLGKPKLKKVASKQKCCTSKTCCTLLANKFQIFPLQNTTEVIPG